MVVHRVLHLRASTKEGLSHLGGVITVRIRGNFILNRTMTRNGVRVTQHERIMSTLGNFAVRGSNRHRLRIKFNKRDGDVIRLNGTVTLLSIREGVPRVAVLFTVPRTSRNGTEVRPVLRLGQSENLCSYLLLVVGVRYLMSFGRAFKKLMRYLCEMILNVIRPDTRSMFTLRGVNRFGLVLLHQFRRQVAVRLEMSTASMESNVLRHPMIKVILITTRERLGSVSQYQRVIRISSKVPIPLIPSKDLMVLRDRKDIRDRFITRALTKAYVSVPNLLTTTKLRVTRNVQ